MNQKLVKGGHTSHLPFHTSNRGITLIALVITIIVLLILAGVTLSMVLGDEGLIAQAQDASKVQNDAEANEQYDMKMAEVEIDKYEAQAAGQIQSQIKVSGVLAQEIKDENGKGTGNYIVAENDDFEEYYVVNEKNQRYTNNILTLDEALKQPYATESTIVMDRNAYITKTSEINMKGKAQVTLDLSGNNIIFTYTKGTRRLLMDK